MAKPLVSIIIPTYQNGLPHVKKCLASLSKVNYSNFEVILVDNGSTDNTVKVIQKSKFQVKSQNYKSKVKIIRYKENVGFCRGNNQAAKVARGKYILLLNNDTVATPNFLTILVDDLEKDKSIGVVQPKIRQLLNKDKLDACCSFLTSTGFLYHYGYSQKQSDKNYNKRLFMYSAKGACFLTRKSLIDKIGLFDEDYFAYFEESDFCHRVWLSGFKVLYEPSAEIFHLGGTEKRVSSIIQFHSYKNRIATYIKNFESDTLFNILSVHIFMCLGIAIAYLMRGKFLYSCAIVSAILWNLINLKNLLHKRRFVQTKLRVVKDINLLPEIKKSVKVSYYKHFLFNPRGYYKFEEI